MCSEASSGSSDSGWSPSSVTPNRTGFQTLVWCHEHCHKETSVYFRKQLARAAAGVDARLHCLKKSLGFKKWAQSTKSTFFALLVDWREAKPCADYLMHDLGEKPHVLVVYTETERQHNQALSWSSGLKAQGYSRRICVLPSKCSGMELALEAAQLLRKASDMDVLPCRGESGNSPVSSQAVSQIQLTSMSMLPHAIFQVVGCVSADQGLMQQMHNHVLGSCIAAWQQERSFVEVQRANWAKPVAEVMARICPVGTCSEIQSALRAVEPEHYED